MQLRSGVPACVAAPHLLGRRPSPVSDLRLVDSFRVGVVDAFNDLALEPLFQMFGSTLQSRHAVNDIDGEVEAVDLVTNRQFQRSIDVSPLETRPGFICPRLCPKAPSTMVFCAF